MKDNGRMFLNGTMMQYFHWYLPADGRLWSKLLNDAEHLSKIGITAVWLPPAYKGFKGINDVGYGVYDLYDLGEFYQKDTIPTKYGTKDQYLAAIDNLHYHKISVYADVSMEHKMGADETEEVEVIEEERDNRNCDESNVITIEAWTKFTFPGRDGKYSSFIWDKSCFDGVDFDEKTQKASIYRFKGKSWQSDVDSENGNYDYLMGADLDFSEPKVLDELLAWGEWYVNLTNVDGFRIDAAKHFSYNAMRHWITTLREKTDRELFTVSEYWSSEINQLENYLNNTNEVVSLFDVPLHFNFQKASSSNGEYDMRNLLKGTLMERKPRNAVTFVDNHDTQKGQSLESFVYNWFKPIAYAVILLRKEGYPCIFYADYYGDGKEGSIPSMESTLDILLKMRKEKAYGPQHDYFDHCDVIGWTREGLPEIEGSGLAVVATNGPGGFKDMYIGEKYAGKIFYDVLGNRDNKVIINDKGIGCFIVNGGSVSVWIEEK